MKEQTRKVQRWLGIIRQRTAHRQTVASDRLCYHVLAPSHRPLNLPNTFDMLLEVRLGVPIGINNRLGCFFERMKLAQLVGNIGQDLLHREANGALGIRDHGSDRHRQRGLHFTQHVSEVLLAHTVEAAGKQNFTR